MLDLQDKGTSVIEKPSEDLASEPKEKRKQTPTEERTDVSRKKADEKTDDAVKKGKDKTDVTVKKAKEKTDVAVKKATDKTDVTVKKVKEKTDVAVKKAKEKTDKAVKKAKVLGSEEGVRRNAEVEAAHVPIDKNNNPDSLCNLLQILKTYKELQVQVTRLASQQNEVIRHLKDIKRQLQVVAMSSGTDDRSIEALLDMDLTDVRTCISQGYCIPGGCFH